MKVIKKENRGAKSIKQWEIPIHHPSGRPDAYAVKKRLRADLDFGEEPITMQYDKFGNVYLYQRNQATNKAIWELYLGAYVGEEMVITIGEWDYPCRTYQEVYEVFYAFLVGRLEGETNEN